MCPGCTLGFATSDAIKALAARVFEDLAAAGTVDPRELN